MAHNRDEVGIKYMDMPQILDRTVHFSFESGQYY